MAQRTSNLWRRVRSLWRPEPIRNRAGLVSFLASRSAHVAQTGLHGYLKARMGTRWSALFQDPDFAAAIETAQTRVFMACLADLTVFAVASLGGGTAAAVALHEDAAREALGTVPAHGFAARAGATDWTADPLEAFRESPEVLADAAPVTEAMASADRVLVMASLRNRWIEVRRQFRERVRCPGIALT